MICSKCFSLGSEGNDHLANTTSMAGTRLPAAAVRIIIMMTITLYDEYDDYYLCRLFFDKITDDITTLSLMTTVRKVLKKT